MCNVFELLMPFLLRSPCVEAFSAGLPAEVRHCLSLLWLGVILDSRPFEASDGAFAFFWWLVLELADGILEDLAKSELLFLIRRSFLPLLCLVATLSGFVQIEVRSDASSDDYC